ncbi:hypothetical protein Vretimale_14169 [Volvox reticuliferus]|nr:hypothetical protein Vretimale_14169 [Volvox reticuliferus]
MLEHEIEGLQNLPEHRHTTTAPSSEDAPRDDVMVNSTGQEGGQSKSAAGPVPVRCHGSGSGSGFGSGLNLDPHTRDGGRNPNPVTHAVCQVVSLGAGMCTRPWRLPRLASCDVFELDLPHIVRKKAELLREAGAQCTARRAKPQDGGCDGAVSEPAAAAAAASAAAPIGGNETVSGTTDSCPCGSRQHRKEEPSAAEQQQRQEQWQVGKEEDKEEQGKVGDQQRHTPTPVFKLLAASYVCIGADLSAGKQGALAAALTDHGFDPAVPTIWVLEALLYYMPLAAASELLCQLAALSAPGSRLIATCVDLELLEASLKGVPKDHIFADLWHFEAEALLYNTTAFRDFWQIDWVGQPEPEAAPGVAASSSPDPPGPPRRLPASTRRLAKECLGADTYVALYGGSELLFAAGLRQPLAPSE